MPWLHPLSKASSPDPNGENWLRKSDVYDEKMFCQHQFQVDAILKKENFSLEELLDEEELMEELGRSNSRLINFLSGREQVKQLLRYIVEEPPEGLDMKFPHICCEILTCETKAILNTLAEEEQLMDFLFSFLEPNRDHKVQLSEYFQKVVLCLIHRRALNFMIYIQEINISPEIQTAAEMSVEIILTTARRCLWPMFLRQFDDFELGHQDLFRKLVDLTGVYSITKLLVQLLGEDDHVFPDYLDLVKWLSHFDLLEMIVDKLDPNNAPTVHSNAAEILCAIAGNVSSPLATNLSSPRFIEMLFDHALQDSASKSSLIHSLSVCVKLLNPKRETTSSLSEDSDDDPVPPNSEMIYAMLLKLDDFLRELNASSELKILPTSYGELNPPLGRHRLKIVELIALLISADCRAVESELVRSGILQRVVDLFFEYPFNNFLHHHVETIISSCLVGKRVVLTEHLLHDCNLIEKILRAEKYHNISVDVDQPTICSAGKKPPRDANIGHITNFANSLVLLGHRNIQVWTLLQENREWNDWQASILRQRNLNENVYGWNCGRPSDRPSDRCNDDNAVSSSSKASSQGDADKVIITPDAPDQEEDKDASFEDEWSEAVISSMFDDNQRKKSVFSNANWFSNKEYENWDATAYIPSDLMADINFNRHSDGDETSNSNSDLCSGLIPSSSVEKGDTSSQIQGTPFSARLSGNELDSLQGLGNLFSLHRPFSMDERSGELVETQGIWLSDNPFDIQTIDWDFYKPDGSSMLASTSDDVATAYGLQGLGDRFSLDRPFPMDERSCEPVETRGIWLSDNPFDVPIIDWNFYKLPARPDGSSMLTSTSDDVATAYGHVEGSIVKEAASSMNIKEVEQPRKDANRFIQSN